MNGNFQSIAHNMTDSNRLLSDGSNNVSPDTEHKSSIFFVEDEMLAEESINGSFVQLPSLFTVKSMNQIEKNASMSASNIFQPFLNRSEVETGKILKNTLNKLHFKKVKALLNEKIESDDKLMTFVAIPMDEELSPKTRFENEYNAPKKENKFFYLCKKNYYETLWDYTDKYPCLKFRIFLMKIKYKINDFCFKIISSRYFESLSLLVILWNTIVLAMDDGSGSPFDTFFLIFYTVEMGLKILGLGLIWYEISYLRSGWNWLDMTIVITGYLPYILSSETGWKISVLRVLRVIRPLKTISALKNLMMIISTLFSAMPYILNTLLILFFFLLIYSIVALQIFQGNLKQRCIDPASGLMEPQISIIDPSYFGIMCGYDDCPNKSICSKMIKNPNFDTTSLDTFLWALFIMIQEITLENWSYNMYYVIRTTDYYGVLTFFLSLAFIGAFIFLNLLASVISTSYEEQAQIKTTKKEEENSRLYNESVQHYLEYKSKLRAKKRFIDLKTEDFEKNQIRYQDVKDAIAFQTNEMLPLEIELQQHIESQKKEQPKIVQIRNKLLSIEEMTPFFLKKKDSLGNTTLPQEESKKNSNEKNDNGENKKNNLPISNFSLNGEKNQATITSIKDEKILKNPYNNFTNSETELPIIQRMSQNKWVTKLKLNKLFNAFGSENLEKKFKGLKLQINHSCEFEFDSIMDVIAETMVIKKNKQNQIFALQYKSCKFEIDYQKRENFKLHKLQRKKNIDLEKVKQFLEMDENISVEFVKSLFWNEETGLKLPLKITSHSFAFQNKIDNLFKIYQKKKKRFFNFSQLHQKSGINGNVTRKKKRPPTIVFSLPHVIHSMNEILNAEKEEEDKNEINEFSNEEMYKLVLEFDYKTKKINEKIKDLNVDLRWSGREILRFDNKKGENDNHSFHMLCNKEDLILKAMSTKNQNKLIWQTGFIGIIEMLRYYMRNLSETKLFEYVILLIVLLNTIILSMNGYLTDPDQLKLLESINEAIVYCFIGEMAFKLIAFGIFGYIRSSSNRLDGIITIISSIDLVIATMNYKMNIIRSLRILRVTRILRPLAYMKVITKVIVSRFSSFIYICFLLVLLIVIYTLIGKQIYGNQLDNNGIGIRQNFDTFYFSLLSVFQLVSIENWNDLATITINSNIPTSFTMFYLLSLIFFGNYVFLNLFMGVLLEGFSNVESLDEEDEDENEILDKNKTLTTNLYNSPKNQSIPNENETINLSLQNMIDNDDEFIFFPVKKKIKFDNPWEDWHCEDSLWCFNKKNCLRKVCLFIVSSQYFKLLVYFLIIINSIKLGLDDKISTEIPLFSNTFDYFLGACLIIEALLKIIAYGFVLDAHTYLRNYWNVLDFFVVIISVIDISLINYRLHFLKVFLLIRVLKLLSINENMRIVVMALIKSIGPLLNLIVFVFIIFLIFALVGINLLQNRMGFCASLNNPYGINKETCINMGYEWAVADTNFDNVFQALISIFILSTQENWPYIMYTAMDSDNEIYGPSFNNYQYVGIYFIVALTVLNFFLINLFVGVLCDQFLEAKKRSDPYFNYLLNESEIRWIEYQQYLPKVRPKSTKKEEEQTKESCLRLKQFVDSKLFEVFLILCVVGNVIVLALSYDGEPINYERKLDLINYVFTGVFICEACLKILTFGIKKYFSSGWNNFDFLIVITSCTEIIVDQVLLVDSVQLLRIAPQLIRIFRILRVLRVIKLIKRLTTLKKIISTLVSALPSIGIVGLLYFIVFYIYAIIGVMLFGSVVEGDYVDDYNNFTNVGYALILCFKMVTGENWWGFMFDCYKKTQNFYAPLYFISFEIIASFIVQSLFILVIIQTLEKANEENSKNNFKIMVRDFKDVWKKFAVKNRQELLKVDKLVPFFGNLNEPLGFKNKKNHHLNIAIEIMKMNIERDNKNFVHFYDVLFSTFKRIYGTFEKGNQINNIKKYKYLKHIEELTLEKIDMLKRRQSGVRKSRLVLGSPLRRSARRITVNPASHLLYLPMILKIWRKYAEKHTKLKEATLESIESISSYSEE